MKRLLLFLFMAPMLALAACDTGSAPTSAGSVAYPASAVTPLGSTAIDDQAIRFAFQSFDAVLDTVDALVATKVIVKGTPRALAVKAALDKTLGLLNAASSAQKAGNATDYASAFAEATKAIAQARAALSLK